MWINLTDEQKLQVLEQVENAIGLPAFVVEKDWWACVILKTVFQSKYADSIIFKGGTSLSKAYNLIDCFSEDIDLIIDRHLLGFDQLGSKSQIKKLRKASGGFIINEFREELITQLDQLGIDRKLYEIILLKNRSPFCSHTVCSVIGTNITILYGTVQKKIIIF